MKPKRPEEQIVTDERGRQLFHGAFTGGFSAGYFNSVGSKEGWAPSTFKSSRSDRATATGSAASSNSYRPEDFMDDEDFAEHGIAPRNLKIKADYKAPAHSVAADTNISSKRNHAIDYALDELIRPAKNTVGVRMMRRMGWREGTGVGPRIKRRLRKLKSKLDHSIKNLFLP